MPSRVQRDRQRELSERRRWASIPREQQRTIMIALNGRAQPRATVQVSTPGHLPVQLALGDF
jgi:predicted Fe-S protein YdhL (DUF1289 family)